MPGNTEQSTPSFSYMEGILLLVAFVVVSLTFAGFVFLVSSFESAISLPMLAIAGIVLLLICLAGIAYVFARTGLQDRTQALGLPPGSMQAVIALSLVVLFAILSIFLFTSMGGGSLRYVTVATAADRDLEIEKLGPSFAGFTADLDRKGVPKGTYSVFLHDPPAPGLDARNDVAKQLIILIGTLMTSAVGFYFGSRATVAGAGVAAAAAAAGDGLGQQSGGPPLPSIDSVEPAAGIPRGQPSQVKVTGTGLSGANIVIRQGQNSLPVTMVVATDTEVTCTVSPDVASPPGDYDVVIRQGSSDVIKPAALKLL